MAITLKEFAKEIGYSPSTISKALNDSKSCYTSETVKASIREKAAKLGYRPNLTARNLITQKSSTIGILLPSHGGFYSELVRNMEFALEEKKYFGLFMFWRPGDGEAGFRKAYDRIVQRGIDGIITCQYVPWLKDCEVPLVCYGNRHDDVDCVFPDKVDYGYRAVDFFFNMGHRRIAYIGKTEDLRCKIYRTALESKGISFNESWVSDCSMELHNVETATENLLKLDDRPTAILAHNDTIAYAVIHTILRSGFKIPDDISVMGFDDLPESKYYNPPLTTFDHHAGTVAELLVRTMLNRIETPDMPLQSVLIRPDIIERASTGPCRRANGQ